MKRKIVITVQKNPPKKRKTIHVPIQISRSTEIKISPEITTSNMKISIIKPKKTIVIKNPSSKAPKPARIPIKINNNMSKNIVLKYPQKKINKTIQLSINKYISDDFVCNTNVVFLLILQYILNVYSYYNVY